MLIIEDTRNKKDKHENKHRYWVKTATPWIRASLPFGDYWPTPKVAIDTKQDIQEIAANLCGAGKEKRRFREECKKAQDADCRMIFLIEDKRYDSVEDLYGKKIYIHSGQIIPGDQVALAMRTHEERYGCEFWFCNPEDSGKIIAELLEGNSG